MKSGQAVAACYARLRASPLDGTAWAALAQEYRARGLWWQGRYTATQASRCGMQMPFHEKELASAGDTLLGRLQLPDAPVMLQRFEAAVAHCPDDWLSWLYLSRLHDMSYAPDASLAALARASALEPIVGESRHWLGVWQFNAGQAEAAVRTLGGLVDVRPVRHGSMLYLALALLQVGNEAAAQKAFTRAGGSRNADFLRLLRQRLFENNYWQQAADLGAQLARQFPGNANDWRALAEIHIDSSKLKEARHCLDQATCVQPGNDATLALEARYLARLGDVEGSLSMLQAQQAASENPNTRLVSCLAMTALYSDRIAAEEKARMHKAMMRPIENAFRRNREFPNDRDPSRRIRLGYVSGDLHRQHPVCLLMLPVLMQHDKTAVEVCIYHTGRMRDTATRQAALYADRWAEAGSWTDEALRRQIAEDGIDILVDLAGQTSSHRLGLFAAGAAPVQASFLGYPHSTGLACMDWFLGDAIVSPPEHAGLFTEQIARLPDSVFCWAPVEDYPLTPARAHGGGPFTFGSFNNLMKVTERTIALWARVVLAVRDSRLLLKAPTLQDPAVRERISRLFECHGVPASRIEMRGPTGLAEMMQEYGDVDVALDPLPYNGGATSLQALWMGVPLVSMPGGNFASRMGASFLHALERDKWIARDEDEYVTIAATLAAQATALRLGRPALREQVQASGLGDISRYTRGLEGCLRMMWAQWCNSQQMPASKMGRHTEPSTAP